MVQAIFFDVDGTLVSFRTHTVSPGVLDALRHEKSIVQISMDMGMSTATVSRRIRSIKDKIGTELP